MDAAGSIGEYHPNKIVLGISQGTNQNENGSGNTHAAVTTQFAGITTKNNCKSERSFDVTTEHISHN